MKSLILRFAASRFVILLQRHRQDWFHNSLKCIFSSKDFNCAKLEIRRKILAVELVIDDQRQRNIWILDLSPKKFSIVSILLVFWINQVPDTNTNQSIKYQSESARPYPPYISCEENSQLPYSLHSQQKSKTIFLCSCKKNCTPQCELCGFDKSRLVEAWRRQSKLCEVKHCCINVCIRSSLAWLTSDRIRYDISNDFKMSTFFAE